MGDRRQSVHNWHYPPCILNRRTLYTSYWKLHKPLWHLYILMSVYTYLFVRTIGWNTVYLSLETRSHESKNQAEQEKTEDNSSNSVLNWNLIYTSVQSMENARKKLRKQVVKVWCCSFTQTSNNNRKIGPQKWQETLRLY